MDAFCVQNLVNEKFLKVKQNAIVTCIETFKDFDNAHLKCIKSLVSILENKNRFFEIC